MQRVGSIACFVQRKGGWGRGGWLMMEVVGCCGRFGNAVYVHWPWQIADERGRGVYNHANPPSPTPHPASSHNLHTHSHTLQRAVTLISASNALPHFPLSQFPPFARLESPICVFEMWFHPQSKEPQVPIVIWLNSSLFISCLLQSKLSLDDVI